MRSQLAAAGNAKVFLWVVLCSILSSSLCHATRHSFHTKKDPRLWIGSLRPPFGFLKNGIYNLTVVDFELKENDKLIELDSDDGTVISDPKRVIEVGFLLKRFRSESDFFKYYENMLSNSSCIFQKQPKKDDKNSYKPVGGGGGGSYDDDRPNNDDDEVRYFNSGEADDPAGQGIPLSLRFALSPTFKRLNPAYVKTDQYMFKDKEEGLYFLMYQVCDKEGASSRIRSTFTLDFHFFNVDSSGDKSYLSAGEMALPTVYFFFFISFGLCTLVWMLNIHSIQKGNASLFADSGNRPVVFAIHQFISLLLILKTCTVLMEAIRYHTIRVSGHAELWSFLVYTFAFLKGTFMFTVILLIGSGWSFVKSYLTQREKNIILAVLVLQVLDNVALAVLTQETPGERSYGTWNAIMHLIDIVCCCAILLPLVWQVNALEKSLERHDEESKEDQPLEINGKANYDSSNSSSPSDEAEKNQILSKLRLFRSFYVLVVAYIYLTRVVVYLFTTTLNYRHLWIQHVVVELVTLTFFVVLGLKFRPMEVNPYFAVHQQNGGDVDDEEEQVELQPTVMDRKNDSKVS